MIFRFACGLTHWRFCVGQDSKSVKCVRDIRSIPPNAYRLPTDGRQWRHLCEQRQRLMWLLATYADGDGTRVWPGEKTLAVSLGLSRRAVTYRLADLKGLGFIENGGYHGESGPRIRTIMIDAIQGAQSSTEEERNLGNAGAQSSTEQERILQDQERILGCTGAQSSSSGAQSSIAHDRHITGTLTDQLTDQPDRPVNEWGWPDEYFVWEQLK
jgi:hypothetical protein